MNGLILFAGLVLFLWLGRSILIPLLVAAFLWYLINAIASYYRKAMPHTKSKLLDLTSQILSICTISMIGYLFITQIQPMFRELVAILPELQTKLATLADFLSESIGLRFDSNMIPNITKVAANIGASVASIATSTGMILVYMLFMFFEQSTFDKKLNALFTSKRQSKKANFIINSIDENMKKYLFIKTLVSAITGVASFIWLQLIGVEFAGVWAFIVFITSYIPTIGAFIACTLPILYSLVTAPGIEQPILTGLGLIGLQILFGNIMEPKLMGHSLNLSTLAILINLVFWGMIWGIAGMFFSVPILVAIFIITAQFDSTRWIAVLLSADGQIPDKDDD